MSEPARSTQPLLRPRDRLLIRLCDELLDTCTIGEPLWRELHAAYTDPALLELLLLAGCYRTVSTLTNALALPLEDRAARFPAR
jgi:hypothetical protein